MAQILTRSSVFLITFLIASNARRKTISFQSLKQPSASTPSSGIHLKGNRPHVKVEVDEGMRGTVSHAVPQRPPGKAAVTALLVTAKAETPGARRRDTLDRSAARADVGPETVTSAGSS